MSEEYIALALILSLALYLFWTAKLRTDITALLVMLGLIIPWPHRDGGWRGILTYQEGFSGFRQEKGLAGIGIFTGHY